MRIINIDEDYMLSGKLIHVLNKGEDLNRNLKSGATNRRQYP